MKIIKIKKLIGLLLLLSSTSVFSNTNNDFQSWNNITVTGALSNNYRYWVEGQGRFGSDVSRLSQSILRSGIGYQLDKQNSIWAGYAWIYTTAPFASRIIHEHRIWQQYLWVKSYDKFRAFARTRLEQRFIENVSNVGLRFRQFGRLQLPIQKGSNVFVSATEEVFIRLNNTSGNVNNKGFDQNRLFVGIGFNPSKKWLLEVGYQNHLVRRSNSSNYQGNYIAMNLIGNLS